MQALLLAQEAGGEATRLVVPTEIDEIIFGAIAFFILFFALSRIAFPAFRKAMHDREQAIRGELERAEQARLEAEQEKEQYARQIGEARSEADRIVREASEAAEQVRRDRIARAEEEARQVIERARQEAAQERDRAFAELQRTIADLSLEAASRVVDQELTDPAAQRRLVERFIEQTTAGAST